MLSPRSWLLLLVGAASLVAASACRTRLLVTDIRQEDCTAVIDGIPFRVRETHTIRVFQWHKARMRQITKPGKDGKPEVCTCMVEPGHFTSVMEQQVAFPNQRRLFALNIRAEQFADYDLSLAYFPDNTLRTVDVKGSPNSAGFADLLGKGALLAQKALSAESDIETKVKEAAKTQEQEASTALTNLLNFMGAVDALRRHCENWEIDAKTIPPEKYDEERRSRQTTARTLLKDAMLAADKAKQVIYSGNPFTLSLESICALAKSLP